MTDTISPVQRSAVMRAVKSKGTEPEMTVRRALHGLGFRYRLHLRALPGTPDIVLPRYRAAIQVRGCFWHCHKCKAGTAPASRLDYWLPKLTRNKNRDRLTDSALRRLGWKVIVVWECKLRQTKDVDREIRRITYLLKK